MIERRTFRAMGTEIELLVDADGAAGALEAAEGEFHRLESLLSRFRDDSELSRLNRAGSLTAGPDLCRVVELALAARERTGGRFDPTVHNALVAAGYDRTFEDIAPDSHVRCQAPDVSLGDARVVDRRIELSGGGLATSGRDRRRWRRDGRELHHLIDPRTGAPAETDLLRVTAIAPDAIEAEVAAKSLFLAGSDRAAREADAAGVAAAPVRPLGEDGVGDGRASLPRAARARDARPARRRLGARPDRAHAAGRLARPIRHGHDPRTDGGHGLVAAVGLRPLPRSRGCRRVRHRMARARPAVPSHPETDWRNPCTRS